MSKENVRQWHQKHQAYELKSVAHAHTNTSLSGSIITKPHPPLKLGCQSIPKPAYYPVSFRELQGCTLPL